MTTEAKKRLTSKNMTKEEAAIELRRRIKDTHALHPYMLTQTYLEICVGVMVDFIAEVVADVYRNKEAPDA